MLGFFGVSKKWLTFFEKYLQAPLRFVDDGPLGESRIRKRGIPESHVLSDMFGEVVLFPLDYSFNQATDGAQLYRLYDEFWYWSPSHETCIKGWTVIKNFAAIVGISLNEAKTGSERILADREVLPSIDPTLPQGEIRWGFLSLDPEQGRFVVDQSMVDSHIQELRYQLASTTSIFSWVQAWNTYAGTFFSTNFGTPANCLGQSHVDEILSTLSRVQTTIFDSPSHSSGNGGVAGSLKSALSQRFDINDIPDGYLYFPTSLGGLELQNNLIPFLLVRDVIFQDPVKTQRDDLLTAEATFYRGLKIDWEQNGRPWPYQNDDWQPEDRQTFLSYEEFVRYREHFSGGYAGDIYEVYCQLPKQPIEQTASVATADEVWLNDLGIHHLPQSRNNLAVGDGIGPWKNMSLYWKWVAQLYGPDMIERFGDLAIVDRGWLPVGMVELFRSGWVKWQG